MNQLDVEQFVMNMDDVERDENFGYIFFFVGDDHRVGFVTIGYEDNDFDTVSNLNREGVFRVNIGVSRATYESFVGDLDPDVLDYAALDTFMPHPHYSKQHYLCILNPSDEHTALVKELIREAYGIAATRLLRRAKP